MCELVRKFNEYKTTYGFLAYWLDQRQDKRHLTHGGQLQHGDNPKMDRVLTIMLTLISLVPSVCCARDTHCALPSPLNLCVTTMDVFLISKKLRLRNVPLASLKGG